MDLGTWGPRDLGTLGPWDLGTLGPWDLGTLRPCDLATSQPWDLGTLGPCDLGWVKWAKCNSLLTTTYLVTVIHDMAQTKNEVSQVQLMYLIYRITSIHHRPQIIYNES